MRRRGVSTAGQFQNKLPSTETLQFLIIAKKRDSKSIHLEYVKDTIFANIRITKITTSCKLLTVLTAVKLLATLTALTFVTNVDLFSLAKDNFDSFYQLYIALTA